MGGFGAVIFDLDGVLWDGEPLYHEAFNVVLAPLGHPALKRLGVPIAVASASLRAWVDATLRGLGLENAFEATVSASEVASAKPAPDLYLTAAARLGVAPARCLAVEDTLAAVPSPQAGGRVAAQLGRAP